jgi:hypothetical protein
MKANRDRISQETRRVPLGADEERGSREQADAGRVDDGMELSQEERDQMLRDDAMQNMLPNPPKRPGVHYFWAAMALQGGASIAWYQRLGYRPVKYEEMRGWADANMRSASGEYAGCITVNEMLLMQCSESDYQRYMRIVHHEKPNEEAGRVKDMIEAMKADVGEQNVRRPDGVKPSEDGFAAMERQTKVRRPSTFE